MNEFALLNCKCCDEEHPSIGNHPETIFSSRRLEDCTIAQDVLKLQCLSEYETKKRSIAKYKEHSTYPRYLTTEVESSTRIFLFPLLQTIWGSLTFTGVFYLF